MNVLLKGDMTYDVPMYFWRKLMDNWFDDGWNHGITAIQAS